MVTGEATVGFHAQYVKDTGVESGLGMGLSGEIKTLDTVERPNIGYKDGYANTVVPNTDPPAIYSDKMRPLTDYPVRSGYAGYGEVVNGDVRYHRLRQ